MSTLRLTTISNQDGSATVPSATVISGSAKAWVNFNGNGTPAIRASFNVSSITDLGTGLYRVTFTTAMPDADYSTAGASDRVPDGIVVVDTYNTGNVRVVSTNGGGGFEDTATLTLVVFR